MKRSSGILLHPTSLPGPEGIGTFGPEACRFVDFLARAGQKYWQILPLGPAGYGDSPYACFSAFAGNPLLVSLEDLAAQGLLPKRKRLAGSDRVDYRRVDRTKRKALTQAFQAFQRDASAADRRRIGAFRARHAAWLEDYALYMAMKEHFSLRPWWQWPSRARFRESLNGYASRLGDAVEEHVFIQYEFFSQWRRLKGYANAAGVRIIGDIPIYVASDSADVWAKPECFLLDERRRPVRVAGVPPDAFSRTGQLWGNPVYDWEHMQKTNFAWWRARVDESLALYDVLRIDHFRAFESFWAVPHGKRTAMDGEWYPAPGHALLSALQGHLGKLPFIVEDLGDITPAVLALRDAFHLPGMKILQYAFEGGEDNPYLPRNYPANCVVYTGNHDNDTMAGWFKRAPARAKRMAREVMGSHADARTVWPFIRMAWESRAAGALVPMQDLLGFGNEARMNRPGTTRGNWRWRMRQGEASARLAARLRRLTEATGR